jgi:methionyl-tRNA synthetase
MDAPIGYLSSTSDWCEKTGESFDRWWRNPDCEIHHFIGKDIVYFHTLFWPVMLRVAGYAQPRKVHVHGFLTVNGEKMSKSKGTYVLGRTYLEHLHPEYLRYYLASKLSDRVTDMDLNLDELVAKVNSDLVGKLVNLASRSARFLTGSALAERHPEDGGLFRAGAEAGAEIAAAYEAGDTGRVTRIAMGLADRANEYVEAKAPWTLRKQPGREGEVRDVCSVALNCFHQITTYLEPVLPGLGEQARALLSVEGPARFESAATPLTGRPVGPFRHMMQRVDPERVQAMIAASAFAPSDE